MPRAIDSKDTYDNLRFEIDFTEGRLEDEPHTKELVATIVPWRDRVAAAEAKARAFQTAESKLAAARLGANVALDKAAVDFSDDLLREVGKDKAHALWRGHFRDQSVSAFIRGPFDNQVRTVRAWLTESTATSTATHRTPLETATQRAEAVLAREASHAVERGELWHDRQQLATWLTDQRDALHDQLSLLARTHNLGRDFADGFFHVRTRRPAPQADDGVPASPVVPTPGA